MDGNVNNLSEKESIAFYNMVMKSEKGFNPVDAFSKGNNPVLNFLNETQEVYYSAVDIQNELEKTTDRKFDINECAFVSRINKNKINDKKLNYVKLLINSDTDNKLSLRDYFEVAQNSKPRDIEKFKQILEFDKILPGLFGEIIKFDKNEFKNFQKIANLYDSQNKHIWSNCINSLVKLPEDVIDDLISNYPNFSANVQNDHFLSIILDSDSQPLLSRVYDTNSKQLIEKITTESTANSEVVTIENFRNNKVHVISRKLDNVGEILSEHHTISKYDNEKNFISKETIITKNDSDSLYASLTDENGLECPTQWVTVDDTTGIRTVQRDLKSPNGTKTNYYYEETPSGTQISEYKIVDSNGKILLNEKRTFRPDEKSPNKYVSSVNDKIYLIEHNNDEIIVVDTSKNKTVVINLDDIEIESNIDAITEFDTEEETIAYKNDYIKDKMFLLQKLSGDKLIALKDRNLKKIIFNEYGTDSFSPYARSIEVDSSNSNKTLFTFFLHEFGHFFDTSITDEAMGQISNSKRFLKVYNKELNALNEHASSAELKKLDYLTGISEEDRWETVAESAMALSTAYTLDRTYYLQKYFPETIAVIAKMLAEQNNY